MRIGIRFVTAVLIFTAWPGIAVSAEVAAPKPQSQETFLVGLAEKGEVAAQLLLGEMKLAQSGKNATREAFHWFRRAAEQGNPEAQRRLAQLYEHGIGTIADQTEALRWYRLAAEQGDLPARCRLTLEELSRTQVP